ncbi:MAG: 30S ribosomal protein S9 [Armatimonadetes bacterium]|nr:30S ribosomal protein S9 [Armatimonadota bacterium]
MRKATSKAFYYGTGRRKTAIARVRLVSGKGRILVNDKPYTDYFGGRQVFETIVKEPLEVTNMMHRFDVIAKAEGGGVSGQAGALRHGIARALLQFDENLRPELRKSGFLTRDPREKERKKYGRKRARKRFQFSKR